MTTQRWLLYLVEWKDVFDSCLLWGSKLCSHGGNSAPTLAAPVRNSIVYIVSSLLLLLLLLVQRQYTTPPPSPPLVYVLDARSDCLIIVGYYYYYYYRVFIIILISRVWLCWWWCLTTLYVSKPVALVFYRKCEVFILGSSRRVVVYPKMLWHTTKSSQLLYVC